MDLLCRLCGIKTDVLHPIFIGKTESMIEECYSIQVSYNDGLSKMICPKCYDKLELSYNFRLQIFRVQEELQNLLHLESQEDSLLKPIKQELNDYEYNIKQEENHIQEASDYEDDNISVQSESSWHRSSNSESSETNEEKYARKNRNKIVVIKEKKLKVKVKKKSNKQNESKAICFICGACLKKTYMREHIANVHGDNRTECDICGKPCNKSTLQKHKKTHSVRTVSCKECGKQLASPQTLYMHMRNVHLGIKNMKCKVCEKVFTQNTALIRHMRVHTSETPYICNYCTRGFNNRWNLTQHVRLHTNEKPYKCKICHESFRQNVALKLHIKKIHST